MSDIVDAKRLPNEVFVPVSLLRDVRKASVQKKGDKEVSLLSPLGFVENIPRKRLLDEYRRVDGHKIRMVSWKVGQKYLVCVNRNQMWFAAYIPPESQVGVGYPDGSARVANKNHHERGDYVVCPADGEGRPDVSRMYIVSNSWFHRMFRFTARAVEIAKEIARNPRNGIALSASSPAGSSKQTARAEAAAAEKPAKKPDESVTEPRISHQERVARATAMETAGWAKVHYPDIYGGDSDTKPKAVTRQAILRKYTTGTKTVQFFIPDDGSVKQVELTVKAVEQFERKYTIRGAKATERVVDGQGRTIGIVLSYKDGSGATESSMQEAAMLAKLGLVDNLVLRSKNGRGYLCGKGGTKLAELPAIQAR